MTCAAEMNFFNANFLLQTPHADDDQNQPSISLAPNTLPSCPLQPFHGGVASQLAKRPYLSFSTGIDGYEEMNSPGGEEELSDDDGSQLAGEKKRRLNIEQVKVLEKNFELGNKLDPERKMQLAKALGLQPRQIAIWFQNRRARWKTKQLEKDYEVLKRQFEAVKAENDALLVENQKLHAEVLRSKSREPTESINLNKETEGSYSNKSENSSEVKLDATRNPAIDSPSSTHPTTAGRALFSSSLMIPNGFLHGSSRQPHIIQCPKVDQTVKEESLSNILICSMDDQAGFWPWLEQPNFN